MGCSQPCPLFPCRLPEIVVIGTGPGCPRFPINLLRGNSLDYTVLEVYSLL